MLNLKIKALIARAVLFGVCVTGVAAPLVANAVLVDNGAYTTDTATGLDWLDLTLTVNVAPRDVLNGAGGWYGMGFRYATTSEVSQLFLDTASGAFINNAYPHAVYTVTPANLAGAQSLLSLMGTVYVQQPGNDYNIVGNGFVGVNEPGQNWIYGASYGTNINGTGGFFFVHDGQWALTYESPYLGSYLVRSVGGVSAVPEPESFALMLLGLSVMGAAARRRKVKQA